MMFHHLHTVDVDDGDSVFLYWRYRWWCFQYFYTEDTNDDAFSIHILKIQMMMLSVFLYWRYRWWCFEYSHNGDTDDDSSVFTYWRCRWWWFRWWCYKMMIQHWCIDEASVSGKVRTLSRQAWCCLKRPSSKGGVLMLQWDRLIPGHLP